ncbi:IclR family transcriptional regulator [Desulfovibrio sp. OttesenSCG-928-F07]|nr:IclR family transcriptional regulator [Desulfovibrio sp. OttesenSCG-928-F07]
MEKDQYLLSSLANSLQILDFLSHKENQGVAEISKAIQLGRASVFRMLYTLEKYGYVSKDEHAKYSLSIKFAYYGSLVVDRQNIVRIARPTLEKLSKTFMETAHLSILTNSGKLVFLAKNSSDNSLQMYSRIGEERDAYSSASGKVMLAYMPYEQAKNFAESYEYRALTNSSITSATQLLDELVKTKEQGYGVDREEAEIGLVCFSAPIFNHRGNCVAAISISGPTIRMYSRQADMIASLKQACGVVSGSLGYTPRS